MTDFGRLNVEGIKQFRSYILNLKSGGFGEPPIHLVYDRETSDPLTFEFDPGENKFADKVEMGNFLVTQLAENGQQILYDAGFWSALGLIWFEQICSQNDDGTWKTGEIVRYIFEENQLKATRHLVWASWWAIENYGKDGYYLLRPMEGSKSSPMEYHGEIMAQFGANQMVASIPSVVKLGSLLYEEDGSGRPRKGTSGKGKGTPRRLVSVMRHFELTYDFNHMSVDNLRQLLPSEFDRWDR